MSEAVVSECIVGDPKTVEERLECLSGLPILDDSETAERLADQLVRGILLPAKANIDALHVAVATVNGITFVLNLDLYSHRECGLAAQTEAVCRSARYTPPIICTPEQLMEG